MQNIILWSVPILVAIVFHEVSHGWVARQLGDPTAERAGRLTLNPIVHVDPIGTILVPLLLVVSGANFLFGWAKPVPVDYRNLRNPRRDMILVAAAGPGMNLVLATAFAILFHVGRASLEGSSGGLSEAVGAPLLVIAQYGILMNVFLGVFNLLPIPPLDGGRVMTGLLPPQWAIPFSKLEPYGFLIVVGLLLTGTLGFLVGPPVMALLRLFLPGAF